MDTKIVFCKLNEFIEKNKIYIDIIKNSYLLLLSELTVVNYIETSLFLENIEKISNIGTIIIGFIGDLNDRNTDFEIVASGTIIIEPKIIRDCKNVGHIEDVVVSKNWTSKGISQQILNLLKDIAKQNNCYKVILNCNYTIKNVYIKNGFSIKGIQMAKYLV